MTESTATSTNYTDEMVSALTEKVRAVEVFNKASATEIGDELGRSFRSVISKVTQLRKSDPENYGDLPVYVAAEKPAPKGPKGPTKAEVVEVINARLGIVAESLVKATASDLAKVLSALEAMETDEVEE